MMFEVTLLRVPARLSAGEQAKLDANCRHIEGRWWIMEGDPPSLGIILVEEWAEGITSGLHPDDVPPGAPIIDHAVDIFGLKSWPPCDDDFTFPWAQPWTPWSAVDRAREATLSDGGGS